MCGRGSVTTRRACLHGLVGCSLVLSILHCALADRLQETEPIVIAAGQRQLFLDDHVIASKRNLTATLHQPEKRGAVIAPDQQWEKWLETRCAPIWNESKGVFQIWLITNSPENISGMTYAESADGIHWIKPILRQWAFKGSLENNFITPDPSLVPPHSVMENIVLDPNDPDPSRRYKGLLGAEYRQPIASPDGIHWSILDAPRIPSMDESNLSYDPLTRTFIASTKVWAASGRSHAIWTSKDFLSWTKLDKIIEADEQDQQLARKYIQARRADPTLAQVTYDPSHYHADIYNIGIFRYEGVYVGMPAFYYATAGVEPRTHGFHLIQLTSSRDLQNWNRLGGRKPFIGPSPMGPDVYDQTQLLPPSAPVVREDELWFYYSGMKYREIPENADAKQGAVCLAVLRRDGFVSLDADVNEGMLWTRPFVAPGTKLWVNVDAAGGTLKIEALDAAGKVLAVSEPILSDQPRAAVAWASGDLSNLKDQNVTLRFKLRKARLYSFWLDESSG